MASASKSAAVVFFRTVMAALFVYAGAIKAAAPLALAGTIVNYGLIPQGLSRALGFYLPWLEIVVGLGLIWKRTRIGATAFCLVLSAAFSIAVASAVVRGLDINCGCFGSDSSAHPSLVFSLFRSIAMFAVSVVLVVNEYAAFQRTETGLRSL